MAARVVLVLHRHLAAAAVVVILLNLVVQVPALHHVLLIIHIRVAPKQLLVRYLHAKLTLLLLNVLFVLKVGRVLLFLQTIVVVVVE